MEAELKSLRIDRGKRPESERSNWATKWILAGIAVFLLLGAGRFVYGRLNAALEVETARVTAVRSAPWGATVVLNATGYVVPAHKIQVASKVLGRVAWIGVEKGDRVREGQVIVRLEDDEYRAQLRQAQGQLAALLARLRELEAGSRPEEVARAKADLEEAEANLANARVNLERTQTLAEEKILARQALDDAKARFDREAARVESMRKAYELVRIGPRREQIDAVRGQVEQARGAVAFYETQLANTLIKAPVTGTILERVVEKGEFVTTSFVGDRGAKGFVVSLADLRDLKVELDISQNDFARLHPRQRAVVTTDAFPDRKYDGEIDEISPEANRQKATVQVKVKVRNPDDYLRPEMNANVAFIEESAAAARATGIELVVVPSSAVRDRAVFLIADGRAVRRPIRTSGTTQQGLRVEEGLKPGEEIIVNPPEELKEGDRVRRKQE